ncbi:MAG: hypothetical protein ABI967_06315 [bacterium]
MKTATKRFVVVLLLLNWVTVYSQTCPISYGTLDSAKPNKVYVYFPAANDAGYPEFGVSGLVTSPAHRFDISELGSYTGTAAALRNAIFGVVTNSYCEFNVQVLQTTTSPPTTFPRRNVVAVGTDFSGGTCGVDETWGLAQNVDTGDATNVDFARVWAGSYQQCTGGAGGELNGVNSTLERWARSIGGTTAHEAGHNYGISHNDGLVLAAGEDILQHHIMARGSNFSYANRAGFRRHFSNNEFSILASNIGLSIQTMWNWDMVNPNAQTGRRLRMSFLSTKPSLILSWSYDGNRSPWINPVVSGPSGTQVFKGTTFNRYTIEWSASNPASATPGQVAGGGPFHVGATFSGVNFSDPDAIIVTDVQLLNGSGTALALKPRLAGFDGGVLDSADGALNLSVFNIAGDTLILQDLRVQELPRVLSLNSMVPGARLRDPFGIPFEPWREGSRQVIDKVEIRKGGELKIPIARMSEKRHVFEVVTERDCRDAQDRRKGQDTRGCKPGVNVDLFPSTTLLVTATLIDPQMKHWDRRAKKYIVGPVATQIFYQIAGRHPDLNKNREDDYIDIATKKSKDRNGDGVPDEAQRQR